MRTVSAVQFVGVDFPRWFFLVVCWELANQTARLFCRRSPHPAIRATGSTFICSTINAIWCTASGLYLTWVFAQLPDANRAHLDPEATNLWACLLVKAAAYRFLAWLTMDLIHCFEKYPKTVGLDALAHHTGFILLTAVQMSWDLLPIVAAWLLIGELSTIALNIRWYVISSGQGDSRALVYTNAAFALSFFLVRILVYWAGVLHLGFFMVPLLLSPPYNAPAWPLYVLLFSITAAGVLNLWWMYKIFKMATRKPKAAKAAPVKRE
jgi:hypothetical protein